MCREASSLSSPRTRRTSEKTRRPVRETSKSAVLTHQLVYTCAVHGMYGVTSMRGVREVHLLEGPGRLYRVLCSTPRYPGGYSRAWEEVSRPRYSPGSRCWEEVSRPRYASWVLLLLLLYVLFLVLLDILRLNPGLFRG